MCDVQAYCTNQLRAAGPGFKGKGNEAWEKSEQWDTLPALCTIPHRQCRGFGLVEKPEEIVKPKSKAENPNVQIGKMCKCENVQIWFGELFRIPWS